MQTEETQDQATPEAKPERHWHSRLTKNGETGEDTAVLDGPKGTVIRLNKLVHRALRESRSDLAFLAEDRSGEPERVGNAYLRVRRLSDIEDTLDPRLFDHPLFRGGDALDCLEEAIEIILDDLDVIEITEDISMTFRFCEERCPESIEAEARQGEPCTDHGHGHAVVVPVHPDGKPVNLADILGAAREGLEEMFAAAGIEVEAETSLPEDSVAD